VIEKSHAYCSLFEVIFYNNAWGEKKMNTEIATERLMTQALPTNVVQVTLPASAYFNLDRFQKVQATVLGRLGHSSCTSGFDIRYDFAKRFVVDEKLNINEVSVG
jgi:hypothetical protein